MLQLQVCLIGALRHQLRRGPGGDAGAPTANQRGRHFELAGVARLLGHALRIGQDGLANGVYQIAGAQLAFIAQPGDHHRVGTRQIQRVIVRAAEVKENLVRPRAVGVQACRQ